jgi:non-ribosomal peptide synthase protein (TIGR01720 family)
VWFEGKGLFWVIHHLIVDGVSWRILLEDLNNLYANKSLLLKSHSYKTWGKYLRNYDRLDATNKYYENMPKIILPFKKGSNLFGTNSCIVTFSKKTTADFIKKAQRAYRTQANDLLLTALVQAIGKYTDYQLCIDLEGHGREVFDSNLDLTRTMGWFTSLYPVYLKLSEPTNLDKSIKETKEQLRQIPEKSITYGISSQIRRQIPRVYTEILFNYLGQWDVMDVESNIFKLGNSTTGQCSDGENEISHDIDINGQIQDGVLSFVWISNYQESIIKEISNGFKDRLEALISYCSKEENYGSTPSDFAVTDINQQELDDVLKVLDNKL